MIDHARMSLLHPARKLLFPLALLVLAASFGLAQEPTPDLNDASLEQLIKAKVYGASKYLQDQRDAPAFVTVLTADEIQKHGYRTLAEVLQAAGSFYITYDRDYSYVGVRGFSRPGDYNSRVLLLIDGHRLNDSLYDMAMVGTEMPLDVNLIERVEIIRGPGASLYGTSAFFAVINVVTRKAHDVGGVELSTEVASFGTTRGRATYGGTYKGAEMLFSGSFYESAGQTLYYPQFDQPPVSNGMTRHTDDDGSRDFLASVSYRNWSLQGLYGRREKGDPAAGYEAVFGDARNRTIDMRAYAELGYTRKLGNWEMWARASFDRYDYYGDYDYLLSDGDSTTALNRDVEVAEWWGTELNLSRSLWKRHRLSLGAEYRDNFRQDLRNFDVNPYVLYSDLRLDSKAGAAYVQDEITITRRILLNAGLRHDYYSTFGGNTNPRLALIIRVAPQTTLKLIYGTAFRAPNVSESYNNASVLNRDLSPESISSSELVVEQGLGKHIRVAASGYHNRIRNLISYTHEDAEGFVFHNEARATVTGVETELTAKWDSGFEGRASYSFLADRTSSDPVTLVNSPRQLGKLALSIPLIKRSVFASADASYVSHRDTLAGIGVGGRTRIDVSLLARRLKRFDLSASIYNLLDKRYADPGFQWHWQDAIAQDGRSFRVGITYRLGGPR